jgi:hypothetical protein
MSRWFDDAAKRAARDEVANNSSGMTRRSALKSGAVVAGAAIWTAPMLQQAAAAQTVASACFATGGQVCGPSGVNGNTTQVCCGGSGNTLNTVCTYNASSGAPSCVTAAATVPKGSVCPSGSGATTTCNTSATAFCGGTVGTGPGKVSNVCGGTGSTCATNADCVSNSCKTNLTCT